MRNLSSCRASRQRCLRLAAGRPLRPPAECDASARELMRVVPEHTVAGVLVLALFHFSPVLLKHCLVYTPLYVDYALSISPIPATIRFPALSLLERGQLQALCV